MGALKINVSNLDGQSWPLVLHQTSNQNSTGWGPGIKFLNASDSSVKWAGIGGMASSGYANNNDLVFYTQAEPRFRMNSNTFYPIGDAIYNLGGPTVRWADVYGINFHGKADTVNTVEICNINDYNNFYDMAEGKFHLRMLYGNKNLPEITNAGADISGWMTGIAWYQSDAAFGAFYYGHSSDKLYFANGSNGTTFNRHHQIAYLDQVLPLSGGTMYGTITSSAEYALRFTNINTDAYLAANSSDGLFLAVYGPNNSGKSIFIETYDTDIYHRKNGTNYNILTSANYSNWACPASGSNNYVKVYNSGNIVSSSDVTFNDLARQGFAVAMIHAAEDNPRGVAGWIHGLSMAWGVGDNSNWISQLAFGVQKGDGLWYRTNQNACVGKPWKRVLDSSNYNSYSPTLTGGGASGTWGINISGNANTAGTANYSLSTRRIENYHITTNGGNAGLWTRAIAATFGAWKNYRQVIAVSSRHQGNGIFIIGFSTHGTTDSYEYDCRYYGTMTQAYINNWVKCYYNPSTGYFSMWVQDGDYSDCNFRILHDDLNSGLIENDTPVSAIPAEAGNHITIKVNAGDTCYNFGANQPSGSAQVGTLYYQTIG